ncbi:zf-C3HC4 type zinc finger protein [Ephemerocybe angulata]|uniref:Zf-C3HC4 type zinc finger protein n=1 Tax=Ephemerocybe angulata TaxID=980116 RepID=A0A8H6IGU1_9AGAR|nr:zf-C3HC4 type zinc finger protein [Tulosesus angulatus]
MGNSSSSSGRHHEESVDYGALQPQGVYTGPRDWNQSVVTQLIVSRKLAPFYRPLEEYDESWDDDQVLAARREAPETPENSTETAARADTSKPSHSKRQSAVKEFRPEAAIYRGATECPICFLYYPANINHSRCCDQAICTECFVQIKRAEPTTTHLVSEPAACPYCVQDNFGVVYTPPPWRAGIGSEGSMQLTPTEVTRLQQQGSVPTHKRRQKSYSADSPEVVTIDQIRPDWEAKLAAVRAAVARRANRRIIMRQVGDRLIPVGIGRIQTPEDAAADAANPGSRRRRHDRNPNAEGGQYVGVSGQDLEELMLMEAMRLSLIDHEEHQRKEAEEKRKKEEADRAAGGQGTSSQADGTSSSTAPALPSTSSSIPASSLAPGQRSQSASRSRTPPAGNNISRSPPPFSTMNAALMSSGTASAFLNSSRPPIVSSSEPVPVPTINLEPGADAGATSTTTGSSLSSTLTGDLPRPPSSSSSLADLAVAYGQLASSPESTVAAEPLLTTSQAKPSGEGQSSS